MLDFPVKKFRLAATATTPVNSATRYGTIRKSLTEDVKLSGPDETCNIDESEVIKYCKCNQENLEAAENAEATDYPRILSSGFKVGSETTPFHTRHISIEKVRANY